MEESEWAEEFRIRIRLNETISALKDAALEAGWSFEKVQTGEKGSEKYRATNNSRGVAKRMLQELLDENFALMQKRMDDKTFYDHEQASENWELSTALHDLERTKGITNATRAVSNALYHLKEGNTGKAEDILAKEIERTTR